MSNQLPLQYQLKCEKAETMVISKIRERLSNAASRTEMFRVFSDYSSLFYRPRIKTALLEYQADLVRRVDEDFKNIQDKYWAKRDEINFICSSRDIPLVADQLIWLFQLEQRVKVTIRGQSARDKKYCCL